MVAVSFGSMRYQANEEDTFCRSLNRFCNFKSLSGLSERPNISFIVTSEISACGIVDPVSISVNHLLLFRPIENLFRPMRWAIFILHTQKTGTDFIENFEIDVGIRRK